MDFIRYLCSTGLSVGFFPTDNLYSIQQSNQIVRNNTTSFLYEE